MAHVFISYKRQDISFATTLRSRIEAAGITVWMDDQLHAGEDWRITIDHAIRESFALVVVMTQAAKQSEYVTYEWACAWGASVPVVPVLLEPVQLHPRLDALQHRNFSDPASQPFDLLIQDLRHIQTQYNAARQNEEMPPPVKHAFDELNSYDSATRYHALDGLTQMQHPAALTALKRAVTAAFYDDVRLRAALRVIQCAPAHCAAALPAITTVLTTNSASLDESLYDELLTSLAIIRDPEAIPELIALHQHCDDTTRSAIHNTIAHIGAAAIPPLMDLLHDGSDHVQQTVSRLLITLGNNAVPALIQALRTDQTAVRFTAAHILGEIGSPDAVPTMIDAIDRSDTHLRRVLVYALGHIADPRAIPALIVRLDDRDMQTVATAVEALSRMEARDAVPALCHVVDRPEPTLKLAAIQALGRLGDPRAADTLITALEYNGLQFQLSVVEALAQISDPAAIKPLAKLVTHPNITLRRSVVNTLAALQHADSIPSLRAALDDPDPQIVFNAAAALIPIGDRDILVEVLTAAGTLPSEEHHQLVEYAAERGADAAPAMLHAFTDPASSATIRRIATEILAEFGGKDEFETLIALLKRPDTSGLQAQIIKIVTAHSEPAAVPYLIKLLEVDEPSLYNIVRNTIEQLGHTATPPLREMLTAPGTPSRWRVAEMLGYTHDTHAAPDLLPLLNSAHWELRWAGAEALGRIQAEQAVPKLAAMLYEDQDRAVLVAVEKALERINTTETHRILKRWRSPETPNPLLPFDPTRKTDASSQSAQSAQSAQWTPRTLFTPPSHKDTLFDDPAGDDLDLFSDDDDSEPPPWPDWLDLAP